jgi:disulfide bond formation protein DsbB
MISKLFRAAFTCPHFILWGLGIISIAALTAALISQYAFGLRPCELCIYQRIPYAVVILLAVLGIVATKQMGAKYGAFNIFLCGIALLINSGIAFYHVGVEEGWWTSGCSIGNLASQSVDDLMNTIKSAPAVSCSAKPWTLFRVSMAGYNLVLCAGLGIYSIIASITVTRKANGL